MTAASICVTRYSIVDPVTGTPSGDFLRVGDCDFGAFSHLVAAEYARAKKSHPENPAFHMRPMFYTGSPFGAEILQLAQEARK